MLTLQDDNCTIMYSENIPYTRVELSGLIHTPQFIETLSSPELFDLLRENQVTNLLLNMSQCWRVGTEDLEWLEKTWLKQLSEVGIQKVSVVTVDQVYQMLAEIFRSIEDGVAGTGLEVHFFDDDRFYNGWDAVSWF